MSDDTGNFLDNFDAKGLSSPRAIRSIRGLQGMSVT